MYTKLTQLRNMSGEKRLFWQGFWIHTIWSVTFWGIKSCFTENRTVLYIVSKQCIKQFSVLWLRRQRQYVLCLSPWVYDGVCVMKQSEIETPLLTSSSALKLSVLGHTGDSQQCHDALCVFISSSIISSVKFTRTHFTVCNYCAVLQHYKLLKHDKHNQLFICTCQEIV